MLQAERILHAKFDFGTQEFLDYSKIASDPSDLTQKLLIILCQFRAENVVFIEFQKIGEFLVPLTARGNLSLEFGQRYINDKIYRIDPFMKKASTDVIPFTWEEGIKGFQECEATERFLALCREFGMNDGIFFPLHTPNGSSCWTAFTGKLDTDNNGLACMAQLALYYSVAMLRLTHRDDTKATAKILTIRQLECIKWIAEGQTDWEIASILGISEATVNRHVELAKERFGVTTRTQVVVKAVQVGELNLTEQPSFITASILSTEKMQIEVG